MAAQQEPHLCSPPALAHGNEENTCDKLFDGYKSASSGESCSCALLISALVRPPRQARTDQEALDLIENLTLHADEVQAHTLAAILKRNALTEYLHKFGLKGRRDRLSFKSLLPVITYEDLQPEIQRIANGDTSPILSAFPVSEFLTSSGTSAGERKLMPTIHDEFERRCLLYSFLMPIMNQLIAAAC